MFRCYIGTDAANLPRVKEEFLEEIKRLRTTRAAESEVEDAKRYLLGSLAFRLNTNADAAGELLMIEKFGLGFDYLDRYREAVAAVTAAQVQDVAQKYLDPERMYLVIAGPVDAAGKPLPKKPTAKP